MTAINIERKEINTVSRRQDVDVGKRHVTDKYWILLLVFVIIIWIRAGPRVIRLVNVNHSHGCRINSAFSKTANFTYECVRNESQCVVNYINEIPSHYSSKYVSQNKLTVDWISRHLDFLDGNYDRSGSFVISANILFCACTIIYSVSSMRKDGLNCDCLMWYLLVLYTCNISNRISLSLCYVAYNIGEYEKTPNFMLWPLPEAVLVFILRTMPIATKNSDEDNDDNKPTIDWIRCLLFPTIYLCTTMLAFIFYLPTELICDNELTYIVGATVICYLCLTLYYFLVMSSSCATSLALERRDPSYWKISVLAPYRVVRYHLGTVCYHATLIFPRIHAMFVMNEAEFNEEIMEYSAIHKFYLIQWKIPNISPTLTGACGFSHSESIRESLRIFIDNSSKIKNFQIHNQTLRRILVLLMAINGLMFIFFWIHGVKIAPLYSIGMWISYIVGFFIASLLMSFCDTVADFIWYRDYKNAMITCE